MWSQHANLLWQNRNQAQFEANWWAMTGVTKKWHQGLSIGNNQGQSLIGWTVLGIVTNCNQYDLIVLVEQRVNSQKKK